jgi:hypothetical protein
MALPARSDAVPAGAPWRPLLPAGLPASELRTDRAQVVVVHQQLAVGDLLEAAEGALQPVGWEADERKSSTFFSFSLPAGGRPPISFRIPRT